MAKFNDLEEKFQWKWFRKWDIKDLKNIGPPLEQLFKWETTFSLGTKVKRKLKFRNGKKMKSICFILLCRKMAFGPADWRHNGIVNVNRMYNNKWPLFRGYLRSPSVAPLRGDNPRRDFMRIQGLEFSPFTFYFIPCTRPTKQQLKTSKQKERNHRIQTNKPPFDLF